MRGQANNFINTSCSHCFHELFFFFNDTYTKPSNRHSVGQMNDKLKYSEHQSLRTWKSSSSWLTSSRFQYSTVVGFHLVLFSLAWPLPRGHGQAKRQHWHQSPMNPDCSPPLPRAPHVDNRKCPVGNLDLQRSFFLLPKSQDPIQGAIQSLFIGKLEGPRIMKAVLGSTNESQSHINWN